MIIIPMMGASSRFFNAGYDLPKFMLPLAGRRVFDWVIESFRRYFTSETFVFVVRDEYDATSFVSSRAEAAGISQFSVLVLERETRGQADTVAIALESVDGALSRNMLTVFNADTFLPSFELPELGLGIAGSLDVFRGDGDHWSFIFPGDDMTVVRTAEKDRISDLCSNGLYVFKDASTFMSAFEDAVSKGGTASGEYYVAPVYNSVIELGGRVNYRLRASGDSVFCGTPSEYEYLVRSGWSGFAA
ncbi:capsular biosynthesis protein [Brevibacterium aurantiacum]|uniref:capsular biosynthesis protein n=1 Tax=Brevibacterium aurantiacum TaxID=273384 RepID=UPI0010544AE5|nr:capsular biosynthesis protein [Brevibacterium aurantiacum]